MLLSGCAEYITDQGMRVARVDIAVPAVSLVVGDSLRLTAVAYNTDGRALTSSKVVIAWSSSVPAIAAIDAASGWVVARQVGQATIRATIRGTTDSMPIVVVTRAP
jgi:hypothetical protein